MSRLKELVSKGVRLIVTDSAEAAVPAASGDDEGQETPRRAREREIPPEAFAAAEPRAVQSSRVPADVADFGAVYQEAGIELPLHGYGVDKVGEMLESKRLAPLGREVKAQAVMAALEAAQVSLRDVIQDAVLRDQALDAFEAAKETELGGLKGQSEQRIQAIKDEIDSFLRQKNAEIEELKRAVEGAGTALSQLKARKQQEEERIHAVVAHFVEGADNPITTRGSGAAVPPPKPDQA
ncbi:MAG TPA: hypothetical protein VF310_14045 [Vicinamibacteria bacterium]